MEIPAINLDDIDMSLNTKQQLAKLVIGTVAGYAAGKLSDQVFMRIVAHKRLQKAMVAAVQQ